MRVLYINHTTNISGAGLSLGTLIRHLPNEVERYFWLPSDCEIIETLGAIPSNTFYDRYLSQFPTTLYGSGYSPDLYVWHTIKGIAAVPRLRKIIQKWQIDLIHINETTLLAYAFAAAANNIPVVLHARTALKKNDIEAFLIKQLARLSRLRIITIDDEVKDSFPLECQHLIQTVYNPIDLPPAPTISETQNLRDSWGIKPDNIVVGQVASLHTPKGIWMILEIAEKLCQEFKNLRFVLVGDTRPERGEGQKLKEAIRNKGLEACILLTGYNSNLSLVYSVIDIALCLFGGGLGGVGRTAYEAALSGKALIATLPNPNTSQTLQNKKTGLLYTPTDKTGIEDGIRLLIRDPAYRLQLGESAKETIGERHSPEKIAPQVYSLYQEMLR